MNPEFLAKLRTAIDTAFGATGATFTAKLSIFVTPPDSIGASAFNCEGTAEEVKAQLAANLTAAAESTEARLRATSAATIAALRESVL